MYEKRIREKKQIVQDNIAEWLNKQSCRYPVLKGGTTITLSGPDPLNAINALRGTNPKRIILYEQNERTWEKAESELAKARSCGEAENAYLSYNMDIHNQLHDDCNCFYYDFCVSYKNIDWDHIAAEFSNQMKLDRSFSVVLTLGLRGKGCGIKKTQEAIKKLYSDILRKDRTYVMKRIKKAYVYHGGPSGKGTPMYVWAAVFLKGDNMPKNLRKKHPGLFGLEEQSAVEAKEKKEMKKTCDTESTDMTKEMVHVLLSNKKRNYTNKDIAEMTGLGIHQVAAMAAWHTGKLKAKRK